MSLSIDVVARSDIPARMRALDAGSAARPSAPDFGASPFGGFAQRSPDVDPQLRAQCRTDECADARARNGDGSRRGVCKSENYECIGVSP